MQDPKFQFGTDDTIYRRDGSAPIPVDEPVMLLRGKDEVVPYAIRRYIEIMDAEFKENGSELAREHAESARERLAVILAWQRDHPERVGMGCHTCEHFHRERLESIETSVTI